MSNNDWLTERMQNCIDELEQENRLLRARNDRLEKEISELQENGCKFPLCQNEEYQQGLAEQIKRELYTEQPAPMIRGDIREGLVGGQPTQEQIIAGAKALGNRVAETCNIDQSDQWKFYSEELIEDSRLVLTAAFNVV